MARYHTSLAPPNQWLEPTAWVQPKSEGATAAKVVLTR